MAEASQQALMLVHQGKNAEAEVRSSSVCSGMAHSKHAPGSTCCPAPSLEAARGRLGATQQDIQAVHTHSTRRDLHAAHLQL